MLAEYEFLYINSLNVSFKILLLTAGGISVFLMGKTHKFDSFNTYEILKWKIRWDRLINTLDSA